MKFITGLAVFACALAIYPGNNTISWIPTSDIKTGWELWSIGDFNGAEKIADEVLETIPASQDALRLKIDLLYVRGKYDDALHLFTKMNDTYDDYGKVRSLMGEALLHLGKPGEAFDMFNGYDSVKAVVTKEMSLKPFSVTGDKTYVIPFLDSVQLADNMPAINAELNGSPITLRMDTGGHIS